MIRTTVKESHCPDSPSARSKDHKYATKRENHSQSPSMPLSHPRTPKKSHKWVVLLSLGVFILLLLSRNQDTPELLLQDEDFSNLPSPETVSRQRPIRQISVLGERNSGTRWTYDHISDCFGHALTVEKSLTRYKHWFQYDNSSKYPHDTLVLAQFRNPYDWFKAMEHVPHHSPAHLRTATGATTDAKNADNDWKVFLTKPWTTERVGADLLLHGNETCQDDFHYRDVVSCVLEPLPRSSYGYKLRYSEHQPFYEMRNDGSGEPYPNIMEMRTDKIRNFLSVANYEGVADVWAIQYEYLLGKGTEHLLKRVEEWTGVKPRCKAKEAQNRKSKKSRKVDTQFAAFVRQNLNWTVEGWIGFDIDLKREERKGDW